MRRSTAFALAVLILLVALLGSWIYFTDHPLPFGNPRNEQSESTARDNQSGEDPFAPLDENPADRQDHQAGREDASRDEPADTPELPQPEIDRARPPDAVETGSDTVQAEDESDDEEEPEPEIEAVLVPGRAGAEGRSGDEDLEVFIASTLRPAVHRVSPFAVPGAMSDVVSAAVIGRMGVSAEEAHGAPRDFKHSVTGQLVWPLMDVDAATELTTSGRRQAVIYFARLPEFRALVDADEGWFRLPMTERMEADYRKEGLQLVVHSPVFEIEGGHEATTVKHSGKELRVRLQLATPLQVIVDVSPAEEGVRVWLERRGLPDTPDFDDSLYISAKLPASGRLYFSVPERYGEIRIGASGESWHSGMPQRVRLRSWQTPRVNVVLHLEPDQCDLVTGTVIETNGETAIAAARLESTHYGATVYTTPEGRFETRVPFDGRQGLRQFHVTAPRYRPEVVALESRSDATRGVEGLHPGPFTVKLADRAVIDLQLPKAVAKISSFRLAGVYTSETFRGRDGRIEALEIPWGARWVTVVEEDGEPSLTLMLETRLWSDAFRIYARGSNHAFKCRSYTLEEEFRKR